MQYLQAWFIIIVVFVMYFAIGHVGDPGDFICGTYMHAPHICFYNI